MSGTRARDSSGRVREYSKFFRPGNPEHSREIPNILGNPSRSREKFSHTSKYLGIFSSLCAFSKMAETSRLFRKSGIERREHKELFLHVTENRLI